MRNLENLIHDAGEVLDRAAEAHLRCDVSVEQRPPTGRWVAAAVAVALVAAVSSVAISRFRDGTGVLMSPANSSQLVPVDPGEDAVLSASTVEGPPSMTAPTSGRTVTVGSVGDDVRAVENRLVALGFFVGDRDGEFDEQMEQAVWAWKELVGNVGWRSLNADPLMSVVDVETQRAILNTPPIIPRRPNGGSTTHVEIYLPLQVMAVFTNDVPVLIAHISSGSIDDGGNATAFCERMTIDTDAYGLPIEPPQERDICGVSNTPGGLFEINMRGGRTQRGPLGSMYRPQYFNNAIAVHGDENVPSYPASHGTVRVTMEVADALWSLLSLGDPVYVWGQDGAEPESSTEAPSFPTFLSGRDSSTRPADG